MSCEAWALGRVGRGHLEEASGPCWRWEDWRTGDLEPVAVTTKNSRKTVSHFWLLSGRKFPVRAICSLVRSSKCHWVVCSREGNHVLLEWLFQRWKEGRVWQETLPILTHHRSELKVEADNGREVKFHEPPVLVSNTEAYPVPGLTLGPVATKTKTMLTQPLSSRSLRTWQGSTEWWELMKLSTKWDRTQKNLQCMLVRPLKMRRWFTKEGGTWGHFQI